MLQKNSEQETRNMLGIDIVKRELVQIGHEWRCSECGCPFYNPGGILDGLRLNEMILHVKEIREWACSKHVCQLHLQGAAASLTPVVTANVEMYRRLMGRKH